MKRALLINWDNYPTVASGGVYTWARSLVESMPDWEFIVLNQLSNPNVDPSYKVPPNVRKVIELPLFGTNRYEEYYDETGSFISKILRTTGSVIKREFIPIYEDFLSNILTDNCDPLRVADSICNLHRFLVHYDGRKCFEHYRTWEIFLDRVRRDPLYREMQLKDALVNYQMLQRSLQILSINVPRVDLVHCSLAWLPSMVAISCKKQYNTPVVITEHGVAFRELVLYYNGFLRSEPSKIFWTVFTGNVVRAIYNVADLIVPVCHANEVWERRLGAQGRIKVVYNGIDTERFKPMEVKREDHRPTVVSVARISVFKDIIGLIQAIKHASRDIPDVRCLLFGEAKEIEYSSRCMETVKELQLQDNFKFMGKTKHPEKAYNVGDVVAFSSISEAFPFAVIEAMACGKAVAATDVGGVREALEGCGVLVRSRSPRDLAKGIVRLLRDKRLREEMERAALARARKDFSLEKSTQQYRELYQELTSSREKRSLTGYPEERSTSSKLARGVEVLS